MAHETEDSRAASTADLSAATVSEAPEAGTFVPIGDRTSRRAPTAAEGAPDETTNLAELLTEEELKKLSAACLRDYEADVQSRAPRMRKLREFNDMYAMVPKPKSRPWNGAANVMTPILTGPTLQISARLYDMVWPINGLIMNVVPTTMADMEWANITEKFANSYIRYNMPEMAQGMDDTCNQLCLFGSTFRRTYWNAGTHRVCSDWIPIEDFVVAHSVRSQDPSMRDVERYTMVQHLTIYDLEDLADAGTFVNVDKIKPGEPEDKTSELTESIRKVDGQSPAIESTAEDKARQVLEMHRRWRLPNSPETHPAFDGKAHPVMITLDEESEQVLRVALREEDDPDDVRRFQRDLAKQQMEKQQLQQMVTAAQMQGMELPPELLAEVQPKEPAPVRKREICFFTHYRAFGSEGFYGLGYGDLLFGLAKAANTVLQQQIDGTTLRNSMPGFISRQLKMQRGQVNVQPGEFIEVDAPASVIKDAIVFLDPPKSDPATVPLIDLFQAMADKIAGSSETMSGQIPGSNQTAEGMKILAEQMMLPVTVLARRVSAAAAHEFEKIWRCWGVFLEDAEVVDIVGGDGMPESVTISRAMFTPTARVVPASDPRMKSQRVQEVNNLVGAVSQNPWIAGHPNVAKIMETVVSEQLRVLGADRIVPLIKLPPPPPPPPPPQPEPPYMEDAAFLRGQDHAIHPADDHQLHLQEHQQFGASPLAQLMEAQGRQMLENHMRQHAAALWEVMNGGAPQPPQGAMNGQPPQPMAGPQPPGAPAGPPGPPGGGPMGAPPGGGPGPMAGPGPQPPVPGAAPS